MDHNGSTGRGQGRGEGFEDLGDLGIWGFEDLGISGFDEFGDILFFIRYLRFKQINSIRQVGNIYGTGQ